MTPSESFPKTVSGVLKPEFEFCLPPSVSFGIIYSLPVGQTPLCGCHLLMAHVDSFLLLGCSVDFFAHGKINPALEEIQTEGALTWNWFQINHQFIIPIPSFQTVANSLSLWVCPLGATDP